MLKSVPLLFICSLVVSVYSFLVDRGALLCTPTDPQPFHPGTTLFIYGNNNTSEHTPVLIPNATVLTVKELGSTHLALFCIPWEKAAFLSQLHLREGLQMSQS